MAQEYLKQLTELIEDLELDKNENLECKHFFSGAACWVDGKIFVSLTPAPGGLALKLPKKYRDKLIKQGAKPLRYFAKAPIKKEYLVLTKKMVNNKSTLKQLLELSINYVSHS